MYAEADFRCTIRAEGGRESEVLTKEEKGKRKTGVRLKDRGGGIGARKGGGGLWYAQI